MFGHLVLHAGQLEMQGDRLTASSRWVGGDGARDSPRPATETPQFRGWLAARESPGSHTRRRTIEARRIPALAVLTALAPVSSAGQPFGWPYRPSFRRRSNTPVVAWQALILIGIASARAVQRLAFARSDSSTTAAVGVVVGTRGSGSTCVGGRPASHTVVAYELVRCRDRQPRGPAASNTSLRPVVGRIHRRPGRRHAPSQSPYEILARC